MTNLSNEEIGKIADAADKTEQRYKKIIELMRSLGYSKFDEYELIQKIAYQMRMYEIDEEEALDLIEDYYLGVKMSRSSQ